MATSRTALRGLGVLAAASGLALAGTGIASATTSERAVDGSDVSVTFTLEDGELGDACGAVLVPPAAAADILGALEGEDATEVQTLAADQGPDLEGIIGPLEDLPGVIVLKDGVFPFTTLVPIASPSGTVSAEDVPSNLYLQANFCATDFAEEDFAPDLSPVLIGSPLEALGAMSSDGLLETGSALLQGGGEDGIGAILSSTLGGDDA